MFHLYGKTKRCKTLSSLLQNVLFSVYKGKLKINLILSYCGIKDVAS